jgi:capsular polysaccharide biosynthesis protein
MRKVIFEVPQEVMTEFAEEMTNRNLDNTVTGTNEDGEIIIEVEFEKDESELVDELEEIHENLLEQISDDNDD